jgi:hypothetical protein
MQKESGQLDRRLWRRQEVTGIRTTAFYTSTALRYSSRNEDSAERQVEALPLCTCLASCSVAALQQITGAERIGDHLRSVAQADEAVWKSGACSAPSDSAPRRAPFWLLISRGQ